MKKIEVGGLGVWVEIYSNKYHYTNEEMLREAEKTIRRELMKYQKAETNEQRTDANSGC